MRKTLLLALSLAGLFISIYLWWVYTSPSHALVCLGTGCDVVRASRYAVLLGQPLPIYGVAMYAALVLLIFAEQLISTQIAGKVRDAFTAMAGAGFLFSLYLTYLEGFVIHAWCAWCVGSAVTITFIFAVAVLQWVRPSRRPDDAAALAILRKHFLLVIVAIGLGVPAFAILSSHEEAPPVSQVNSEALKSLIRPDSHVIGNPDASLTVVEFGDFECPVCGAEEPVVEEVLKKYGSRIRFVFRQFPLTGVHPDAMQAAEASECAAEQGKFWQAEQKLYQSQTDLTEPALNLYAVELGLDKARFGQCLSSHATQSIINGDMADGHTLGVDRTPTFFIGQQKFARPIDLKDFSNILDQELARANPGGKGAESATGSPSGATGSATPGGFGDAGGNIFSSQQGSEIACSNDEAKKAQPDLIRTSETRQLFESNSKPLFVDVRPAKDFAGGHVPAAVNIPIDEFERRWDGLPKNRTIVLYESGRSTGDICGASRAAGRVLLAHGFPHDQVKVYQDGMDAWQKASLPVER
ncbi:MAG TPA: thioredoxin domain-containing protein [Terriglobia bacterium]|nr:thioredoxin domain-containing protein [Terriglobia bacterium]